MFLCLCNILEILQFFFFSFSSASMEDVVVQDPQSTAERNKACIAH